MTNFRGQAIAIHLRHFGVGEDHQQLVGQHLAGIGPGLEHVQALQSVAGGVNLQPELTEGFAQLREGDGGIVHAKHFAASGALEHRIGQAFGGNAGVVGHDFGEHLLHIDHFH